MICIISLVSGDGPENLWSESVPMSRRVSHVSRDGVMHHMSQCTDHCHVSVTCDVSGCHHHTIITPWHVTCHTNSSWQSIRYRTIINTQARGHVSFVPGQVETGHQEPVTHFFVYEYLDSYGSARQQLCLVIGQCDWGWRAMCVICVNPIITLSPDHWTYHDNITGADWSLIIVN